MTPVHNWYRPKRTLSKKTKHCGWYTSNDEVDQWKYNIWVKWMVRYGKKTGNTCVSIVDPSHSRVGILFLKWVMQLFWRECIPRLDWLRVGYRSNKQPKAHEGNNPIKIHQRDLPKKCKTHLMCDFQSTQVLPAVEDAINAKKKLRKKQVLLRKSWD
jgi:hypothetical protein